MTTSETTSEKRGFQDLVNQALPRVRELSIEEVAEKRKRGEKFVLVDTRELDEWTAGRIVGAIHLGKGVIERDIEKAIPDLNAEIVLYCGGGSRSILAADSIQKMGYRNVYSMDGGFRGWAKAGHETTDK